MTDQAKGDADAKPSHPEADEEPNISNEPTFLKFGDDASASGEHPVAPDAALESGETKILDREPAPAPAKDGPEPAAAKTLDERSASPASVEVAGETMILDREAHPEPAPEKKGEPAKPLPESAAGETMILDRDAPAAEKPAAKAAADSAGETMILESSPIATGQADEGATIRTDARPPKGAAEEKPAAKEERGAARKGAEGEKGQAKPAEKASAGAYLIVAAIVLLVGGALFAGFRQSRVPSEFDLRLAYLQGFRIPEEANPPAEQVRFEFDKAMDCAAHDEDRCLVYRVSGPRLNTTMAVFKSPKGWTLDPNSLVIR